MNSRNPGPRRLLNKAPQRGRWRRFHRLHRLHQLRRLRHRRCILRIVGVKRRLSNFCASQDDPKATRCGFSGKLWLAQCVRCVAGSTRRGLTRGEESEEGGDSALLREDGAEENITFSNFLGGLKSIQKWYPKSDQNCLQKGPQK